MSTLLQIAELGNFKCLMGDCPDTCCKGWEIPVDSKTYNLWRDSSKTKGFVSKLKLINDTKSPNPCSAKIKLKDDLSCSFLSEDLLCSIHSTLGEDFLSHTCRSYPRELNKFWGMFERSMNLSCPEVASIILSQSAPLNLEYVEEDIDPWIFREIVEPNIPFGPELIVNLYKVRTLCLLKAQDRSLSIERRVAVLFNVGETANIDTTELCKLEKSAQDEYFSLIEKCFDTHYTDLASKKTNIETLLTIFKPYVKMDSYLAPIIHATPTISGKQGNIILLEHILFTLLLRSLFPFSSSRPVENLHDINNILILLEALLDNQASLAAGRQIDIKEKITLIQKTMRILDHYEDLTVKMRAL